MLNKQSRSDGALFVLDLPPDPADRTRIIDMLRSAADSRIGGEGGYLAYALVEDADGNHTAIAVIEPIEAGPGRDRSP